MKNRTALAMLLISALAFGSFARANTPGTWLWNGTQSLKKAENCQNHSEPHTPFRLFADPDGKAPARLLTPSDLKSISSSESANTKELSDSVLVLKSTAPKIKIGEQTLSLDSAFLQTVEDSQGYSILACDGDGAADKSKVEYILFDLFVSGSTTPIARVGINPEKADWLRSAQVLSPEEAEQFAAKQAQSPKRLQKSGALTQPAHLTGTPAPMKSVKAAAEKSSSTPETKTPAPTKSKRTEKSSLHDKTGSENEAGLASAGQTDDPVLDGIGNIPVIGGPIAFVICSLQDSIKVEDQSLQDTLFKVNRDEEARPFQSFDSSTPVRQFATNHHVYIKVHFPDRPAGHNIGWIDENDLRLRQKCPYLKNEPVPVPVGRDTNARRFNFPTAGRPLRSYREGARQYGAMRAAGRKHAACDLYRPGGESVQSIDDGEVIRSKYYFYEGVYALEVLNRNGYVARYGEILGRNAPGMTSGHQVSKGQTVGYIGTVDSGCCSPMLHFELYRGTSTGALTQRWRGGFQRRADLMNPTDDLADWEKKKFGASY